MAALLPSLFVLLLHSCSGHVEDADVSGFCENVGADGVCSDKTDRVELMQVNRHSSLKEAAMKMQTGCQTPPSFLSALKCEAGQVCTIKETKRDETFTVESSGGFLKVTLNGHSLYISEDSVIANSPCGGGALKANILEPALLEGHSLTCTGAVLRDVTEDNVFSLLASGSGVDLVDLGSDGSVFMDHLELQGSAAGNGFAVPSDVTEVSRSELFERLSSDCSSLAQVDTLDRALSKKGIGAIVVGGLFLMGAGAACAFGGPVGCVASVGFAKMGVSLMGHGIATEVKYRHR